MVHSLLPSQASVIANAHNVADILEESPSFIRWARTVNAHQSQTEIAANIRRVLRGKEAEIDVPKSVTDAVVQISRSQMSNLGSAIGIILNRHERVSTRQENKSRAFSVAAKQRVSVKRTPTTHAAWSKDEIADLLHALRASNDQTEGHGYIMGDVLRFLHVRARAETPAYDRIRKRIQKIRNSVDGIIVHSLEESEPLRFRAEARLVQLLAYRHSRKSEHALDWKFIQQWLERDRYRFDRERCVESIKDIREITTTADERRNH